MYIIGLTGNIATGKSTVAHILEQFGARVIDADKVAHAIYRRGSSAWRGVVDAFGYDVLYPDGNVDRRKLGAVVFNDPAKLKTLEHISHPAVGTELALLVRDALKQPGAGERILVVEAVKLFEAGMHEYMDALWVVTAPFEEEKRRLMQDRGMTQAEAEARLRSQPDLQAKLDRADVIIDNGGSIEDTRVQVLRAFVAIDPSSGRDKMPLLLKWLRLASPPGNVESTNAAPTATSEPVAETEIEWVTRRAKPADARLLADLLRRIEGTTDALDRSAMLERQGKYGYWLVLAGEQPIALAAWQAENLAAIVRELWVEHPEDAPGAIPQLLHAIETEANALNCEVVIILVPERAAPLAQIAAESAGYALTTPDALHRLWRGVIEPLRQNNEPLYLKRLREMVTRPI